MKFFLVRHAVAMDREDFKKLSTQSDFYRPLTQHGRKKFLKSLKTLHKKKIKISNIYTSPYLRCLQTAEMLSEAFRTPSPKPLNALSHQESTQRSTSKMLRALDKLKKNSCLVGHEPELSELLQELLPSKEHVSFKKGELRCLKKTKKGYKKCYKELWSLKPSRKRRIPE